MELCVGGNLTDWIINQKAAAKTPDQAYEEQWAWIIKQILLGLQYIHDNHELIHRDIKPGNILFNSNLISVYSFILSAEVFNAHSLTWTNSIS